MNVTTGKYLGDSIEVQGTKNNIYLDKYYDCVVVESLAFIVYMPPKNQTEVISFSSVNRL